MDIKIIKDLMQYMKDLKIARLRFKKFNFELELSRDMQEETTVQEKKNVMEKHKIQANNAIQETPVVDEHTSHKNAKQEVMVKEKKAVYITSPMIGTFYTTPSPTDLPFVKVGDKIHSDTVVCIVEAMKVMNEIKAEVSGVVAEVLVDNGQPVEFGTKLFKITP